MSQQTLGVSLSNDIASDTFYGFRHDMDTSNLSIEIIFDGDGVIRLPQDTIISADDYAQWIWTKSYLAFEMDDAGHLIMTSY